jgi:hypothetical protein
MPPKKGRRQWVVTLTSPSGERAGYYPCNSPQAARKTILRGRNEGYLVKVSPPLPPQYNEVHPAILRSDASRAEAARNNNPTLLKWQKERGHLYG